jgi:hypothetical protein
MCSASVRAKNKYAIMAIRAKAPAASIQSDGVFFMRSMSSAVKMLYGCRPVRQLGARLQEWKAHRRG